MRYQPALDGLRALAVAMVLLFHLQLGWASGGYLGVSVFFTLSGFLITTLLLAERDRLGRIDLRRFYGRRARRLLPAAFVALAGISALAALGLVAQRSTLRDEVLSAAFQVKNWSALSTHVSYSDLFLAPSAVDHFWSLAIEEQFYLLWPLTMVAVGLWAARRGDPARRTAIVLGALFVATAISAPLTRWWWGQDAVYLASWTRFAEILAGAFLAAVLHRRSVPHALGHLAPVALAVILVLGVVTEAGRGWAYEGWLPVFALVTVALLVGVQVPSPTTRVLSWGPLVWVGLVSYGIYLYHWPVYLVLDGDRTGLAPVPLAVVRVAVTVALAAISYHLLEHPIRTGRFVARDGRLVAAVGAAAVAVVVAAVVLIPVRSSPSLPIAAARTGSSSPPPTSPLPTTITDTMPVPVVLLGDSVAHTLAGGTVGDLSGFEYEPWDPSQSPFDSSRVSFVSAARPGCSFLPGPIAAERPDGSHVSADLGPACTGWQDEVDAALDGAGPGAHLAVVLANEAYDRFDADGELVRVGSEEWELLLEGFLAEVSDLVRAYGAEVVLVGLAERSGAWSDGIRDRAVAEGLERYAEAHASVRFLDFGPEVSEAQGWRSDGLHYTAAGARGFADWLTRSLDDRAGSS